MGLLQAISAAASGLTAQRVRMDTISGNVANIDTTRTPDGSGPYQRHVVKFMSGSDGLPFASLVQKFTGQPGSGVVLTQVGVDTTRPIARCTTLPVPMRTATVWSPCPTSTSSPK